LVRKRDIKRFLQAAECKIVDSGANVQIRVVDSEDLLYDWRERNGFQVVSPVQIYLDCMEMKGRGEEMAKALRMRFVPDVVFKYDESVDYGRRIDSLLNEIIPTNSDDDIENNS